VDDDTVGIEFVLEHLLSGGLVLIQLAGSLVVESFLLEDLDDQQVVVVRLSRRLLHSLRIPQ
jgi:hypothetical protein